MSMAEEAMIATEQHNAHEKLKGLLDANRYGFSAGNCGEGDGLADVNVEGKNTACKHFSIRGYVAKIRELDRKTCWPFPQHLLETRLKDGCDPVLPPLDIPYNRWWNCQKCSGNLSTPAESTVEKKYVNNLLESSQEYDGNFCHESPTYKLHSGRYASSVDEFQKSMSNADLQEKYKENQPVECLTVELKSSDENSSASELIPHMKDDLIVTNEITDQTRIESVVSMGLEMNNLENLDSVAKKGEVLLHSPDSLNSKENNMSESFHHVQEEEITCAEMEQLTLQKMGSKLQGDTNEKIVSTENKAEILSDDYPALNSWEYFSRNRNIFEEISKIIKEKEMQAATSQIFPLDSKNTEADDLNLDVNKKENINHPHISHGENICLDQHIFAEDEMDKETIPGIMVEPVTVQRVESSIENIDHVHLASEEMKDGTNANLIGNESINTNIFNQRKDHMNHCTNQDPLGPGNALLLEETGKLKENEPKHKRKSQKKRSIADIIASEPFLPEALNRETEQTIHADKMEQNIYRAEDWAQFPQQTDNVKHQKEAEKRLSKSRVGRSDLSEININTDMYNLIRGKGRPEKLKVRKKQQGLGAQFWDSNLVHFPKDSLDSDKSEAMRDNFQVPQDASDMWRTSRDKPLGSGSFHVENGQTKQKGTEVDDEIPMDIVELMAKNQHERGLSKLVNIYESHDTQTGKSLMKMKVNETDFSHVTKLSDKERISHKHDSGTANGVVQLGQSNQANPRAYLRSPTGNDALGDGSKIHVSQRSPKHSSINSGTNGIKSVSKSQSSMLQSQQLFNPWENYCPGFATSVFSGINAASNPSLPPVHSTKPNAAISHSDCDGHFYVNGRALPSVQCQEAAIDVGYKQMQNLCTEASSALSELRNPETSKFQNKFIPSVNHHWISLQTNPQERLIETENLSNIMASRNSNLEFMGSVFDFLNQNHNGKGILNQPSTTDPAFVTGFLKGQNKSGLLQRGSAQAPTFGTEHISAAPELRLMGQSLSVPNGFGSGKDMATENQDHRNFYTLYQGSSQEHNSRVHPITCVLPGEIERNGMKKISQEDVAFKGSKPTQESMYTNNQTMSLSQTVPPVPKFRAFEPSVLNGRPEIQASCYTFPGTTNVAVQSSMDKSKSHLDSILLFGIKDDGVQCSNALNACHDKSAKHTILPQISQITDLAKGLSPPIKGLRSCRRLPTNVRSQRHHRSALDIYLENRCHRLQSSTNPIQSLAEEAAKTNRYPEFILNRENQVSSLYGKRGACSFEICTLNQNPAEINVDDGGENRGIVGYEDNNHHVGSAQKVPACGKRNRNRNSPARGQKHRKTLKIRQLQGFFAQNDDNVGDSVNRNDNMASAWNDGSIVKQVGGKGGVGTYIAAKDTPPKMTRPKFIELN